MTTHDRRTGRLIQWNETKGFGFIAPDAGGAKLLVQGQALARGSKRPRLGERLSYRLGFDSNGKLRAQAVRSEPLPSVAAAKAAADGDLVLVLIPAFALLVLAVHLTWGLPNALWGGYMAMSLATFIVYWLDKRAAVKDGWRVPERRLHLLALLGGWPGALLARRLLRHKTVKPSFQRGFWISVGLNLAIFLTLTTPLGSGLLSQIGNWMQ